jgi:JmjC domain, hydroxylase
MSAKQPNQSMFQRSLVNGEPMIVTDVQHTLQGKWGPDYFVDNFGGEKVTIIDCETEREYQSTVADFFSSFGSDRKKRQILKLKVRFSECTSLHRLHVSIRTGHPRMTSGKSFLSSMLLLLTPYPFLTTFALMASATSFHTLPGMALFPILVRLRSSNSHNSTISAAGPKMYNANGNLRNDHRHGTTRLHLDVTAAINIMLYASNLPDDKPGFAVWHIFPSSTTAVLRKFLQNESAVGFQGPGDPIHNQTIYLTPMLLQLLSDMYDVYPYVIHQHPGDAIVIPANCAHQVSLLLPYPRFLKSYQITGE